MTNQLSIIQKKISDLEKKKKEIEQKNDIQYVKILKSTLDDKLSLSLLAGILDESIKSIMLDPAKKTAFEQKGEAFLKEKPFRQSRKKTSKDNTKDQ
ncbi:MAG: hypothetical protein Q8K37_03810 [Alphaproteobacteria bacterium]|nr:hypothetical protein [Alphaproteobacteria bacterium]MDP3532563.1 hypothetical protein [Alphaproteobacteria bacterium]